MGLTRLLELLKILADWVSRYLRRREHEKAQDAHDQLSEDPKDWFDEHFGGAGSAQRVQPSDTTPGTDANQTNPTDSPHRHTGGNDSGAGQ